MSVHYGGRGPGHIARAQGNRTDWIFTSGGLDGRITFTRASSGTYFDSAGVMQTATTNTPRFNYAYNGSAWVAKGLLIEPAATNLLLRSREFDNASWYKVDTTVTANAATGVGGDATMDLCTEGSAGTSYIWQTATIAANSTNTFAIDLKRGNHDWVFVYMYESAFDGNSVRAWFNLATGAVGTVVNTGTGSGATASVRNLGNGIYRCILTGAINNSATGIAAQLFSASASGEYGRVSGATRYQDRAQLESGSVATSFIETTTATATRAADVALISGTNFSNFFNPVEGAFVVECDSAAAPSSSVCPFAVSDGTTNNRMQVNANNGSAGFFVAVAGTAQASIATGGSAPTANTTFKRAAAYKLKDFAVSNNGSAAVTATSGTVPTVSQLSIGGLNTGSQLNGHVRRLTYYPVRLSDAQLVALSTL